MKLMQTAYYIAICDNGVFPHNWDKCVFAKRGTEPFENLAKGYVINANRDSCDVDCLKNWWIGDAKRIGRLAFTCRADSESDYTGGNMYQACGNQDGLHIDVNKNGCGWRYNVVQDMPSIWIQMKLGMHACMVGYVR